MPEELSLSEAAHEMCDGAIEIALDTSIRGWVRSSRRDASQLLTVKLNNIFYGTFALNSICINEYESNPENLQYFRIPLPERTANATNNQPTVSVHFENNGKPLANNFRRALPTNKKTRGLVLIPAGQRYDHDKIRMHDWSVSRVIDTYSNIGDLMVYDSTLKLLDFSDIEIGNIISFTDKDVDRYNSEFDFVFLRGSNFIHEHMQWQRAGELIEQLKLPCYAIGVGAQAESRRDIHLPSEGKRVWAAIADHCASIGVRGQFSADTLALNGISNVEIIGCPSMFRSRNRNHKIETKRQHEIRNISFSLRRETGKGYARDVENYLKIQRDFMLKLDNESNLRVSLHGEKEEKAFYFRDYDRIQSAKQNLRASKWLTSDNENQMLDLYRNRLFFNTSVEDYDTYIKNMDLAIGYRVHGILPAMANGIPGYLVDYDERSAELATTHKIPLIKEKDLDSKSWRDIYSPESFNEFQKHFPVGYQIFEDFMNRNGVPHRL